MNASPQINTHGVLMICPGTTRFGPHMIVVCDSCDLVHVGYLEGEPGEGSFDEETIAIDRTFEERHPTAQVARR